MKRSQRRGPIALTLLAGAASVVLAQAGAALFLVSSLVERRSRPAWDWTLAWFLALAPVAVLEAALGDLTASATWLGTAAFASAAGWVMNGNPRWVRRGLALGLLLVLLVLAVTQVESGLLWNRAASDDGAASLVSLWLLGHETVRPGGNRSWRIPASARHVSFHADVRTAGRAHAWAWTVNGKVAVSALHGPANDAAVMRFGTTGDPYAQRWFDIGAPVGGHAFRVTAELRSGQPIAAKACRGVWLQAWGTGGGRACDAAALGPVWKTFALRWTAPEKATSHVIRVVLNNFDGHTIEVRNVKLYEKTGSAWERLGPLAPTGDTVSLHVAAARGDPSTWTSFVPDGTWHRIQASLSTPASPGSTSSGPRLARVSLGPAAGSRLEVRNAAVVADGQPGRLHAPVFRQGLWFGHPNLAGHSMAAAGLAAIALPGSPLGTLAIAGLALLTIFFTGSRTALVALMVGSLVLAALRFGRRNRWVVAVLGLIGLASAALVLASLLPSIHLPASLTFENGQTTPRTAIWQAAAAAFASHPITGLAGIHETFQAYWHASPFDHTGELLTHAHDFWLQFASRYGLVGIWGAGSLTVALAAVATRRARLTGLVLVASILFLNVSDYTLFFPGVMIPLILGVNAAGAAERRRPSGKRERPAAGSDSP